MRLQPAIPMSSLSGNVDFGRLDPDERQERREDRQRRHRRRRNRRRARAAERHRSRADRLDEGRPRRPDRERPARSERPQRSRRSSQPKRELPARREATLQPAPEAWEPTWERPEVLDVDWEEVEPEAEPEWMGAARRAQLPARWSPPAKLGRHMRLQAADGHRAAVIELKPGLYLVAELPERVARSEFGVAAVLAPLVVKAASKAIQHRQQTPQQERLLYRMLHREQGPSQGQVQDGQGQPLRRLFMRPDGQVQDEHGNLLQRLFHPHQAQAQPQTPALQPAPGAGHGVRALLPPPEVGWADEVLLDPSEVNRG